ncbi:MAG TPA: hypothetical protein VGD54_00750 [Steroidobacteraceae bacterium]
MGRRRKRDRHLPQRVYFEYGRYWYKPKLPKDAPPGTKRRIDFGTTESEMYSHLSKLAAPKPIHVMGGMFDRFLVEVLPTLAKRTRSDYQGYIEKLRLSFGSAPPNEVTAPDIFEFRSEWAKTSGNVQANRHVSCLSAVFREAIGWRNALGPHAITSNPCHELKRLHEAPRTRYVWDREFTGVYGIASPMYQVAMDLATITGQREDDLLNLQCRDYEVYTEEGIVFRPAKTKRRHPRHGKMVETSKIVIVKWSPELREVVERARKLGPQIRPTLLCTLQGETYTGTGFRSNWHRLIQTAMKGRRRKTGVVTLEPVLKEAFTFNDLRAKNATDEEDFEEAHNRLAHSDRKTTQMVYVRKPRRARAGRKVGT